MFCYVVTLWGESESDEACEQAGLIALNTHGVETVRNRLEVNSGDYSLGRRACQPRLELRTSNAGSPGIKKRAPAGPSLFNGWGTRIRT